MNRILNPILSATLTLACCEADDVRPPKHLTEAEGLVQHLSLDRTNYEHGEGRVQWDGTCESHTDCSGFVDALLMHCYSYDKDAFKRWLDARRPTATRYHDTITAQKGFTEITRIEDVRPGDFFAVKYLVPKDTTGHVMLVADAPHRIEPLPPLIEHTEQWTMAIIDSSKSGHGPADTRHAKAANGKDHDGLGKGVFRIYADKQGAVAGFSWSTYKDSKFKSPADEHLVIGRLKPNFQP